MFFAPGTWDLETPPDVNGLIVPDGVSLRGAVDAEIKTSYGWSFTDNCDPAPDLGPLDVGRWKIISTIPSLRS